MSHKVYITNKQKAVKVPSGLRILIRRACHAVLEYEHFEGSAEISVTFVDDEEIARLNEQYRNKPQPTDVLSFPLGENGKYDINQETGAAMLGDIVISMQRAMEQASLYGHSLQREVAYLTVHSMFHLLGYDHEAGGLEAVRMREKEEATLIQLGLPRTVSYTVDQKLKNNLFCTASAMRCRACGRRCGRSATCAFMCAPHFMCMYSACFTSSRAQNTALSPLWWEV